MRQDPLWRWRILGLLSTAVIVATGPIWWLTRAAEQETLAAQAPSRFVGDQICAKCHEKQYLLWKESDHFKAMAPAREDSVLGDFGDVTFVSKGKQSRFYEDGGKYMVETEGPAGKIGAFEIRYTFGYDPLQQYLVSFPGGKLQCLTIAWDNEKKTWYDLYPEQEIPHTDWLHWTRAAQNWNGMCAECHSTNLKKGYSPSDNSYNSTWSSINVSCEACHGPGSSHVSWAEIPPMARLPEDNYRLEVNTAELTAEREVSLCAPCHSRRSELGDYDHLERPLLDRQLPALLQPGLYHADGQIIGEVYVWGSFTQSKMYSKGVRCSDCHDSHSLEHRAPSNELCRQCHRADAYDAKEHHYHKKIHEGKPSDGALCIKCHMPESVYMGIDERADHSIRIPRPDLSVSIGTPNACSQEGCHDDKELAWILESYDKWYGVARKPHYGGLIAAGRKQESGALKGLLLLSSDELRPPIVRATALSLLAGYREEEAVKVIINALGDPSGLVRHTAATVLELRDPLQLIKVAVPLLFDPLKAVRMQAALLLADVPRAHLLPYQKQALDEATDEYIKTMEYSLDFAASAFNLGNLYNRLGQPREAEKQYRNAILIDDLFYPAKANLAVLLSGRGQNKEALKLLRQIVQAHPDQYESVYSLGLLLAEMGHYREAEAQLAKAAEGMPDHPRVHYNLAEIRKYLSRLEQRK